MPTFTARPAGLCVVDPASFEPFKDDPPFVFDGAAGTGLIVLVQCDSGVFVRLVERDTTIHSFADDKGTNLTFNGGSPWFRQLPAFRDTGCLLMEIRSTLIPAPEATEIVFRGRARLHHAAALETRDFEGVALQPGWKHPDLDVRIKEVSTAGEALSITFEVTAEASLLIEGLTLVDASGQELQVDTAQFPLESGAWLRRLKVASPLEVATLRFIQWANLQVVDVDIHTAARLGVFRALPG
ncbi:MAG: hypothetical protein IPK82_34530 [Polyangiaceae bacterium]|nr:hypothetical protein [Polyangiaceae bacterium]